MKALNVEKNLPFVSIIILNYNKKNLLLTCLHSVLNNTDYPSYEIVVTDNGSSDGSVDEVKRIFRDTAQIKVVALRENLGYAEGNNVGFLNASKASKYIVILNNDVIIDQETWLKVLVEFMEKHKDIGVAQPTIIGEGNQAKFGLKMNVFGEFTPIKRLSDLSSSNSLQGYNECFSALGAAIITRKELVEKIGLFNKRFFLDYEDADFCWRSRLSGSNIVAIHASKVNHLGGGTIIPFYSSPDLQFHILKNRVYLLLVNYKLVNALKYVPWTILLQVYDGLNCLICSIFATDNSKKILKARMLAEERFLVYLILRLPYIWKDRLNVQDNIRAIPDSEIVGKYIAKTRPYLLRRTKSG